MRAQPPPEITLTALPCGRKHCPSLKPHRTFLAALMLFAWLFAGAHMALEHGGGWSVCDDASSLHDGHDDHDSPPADGHHHHDLGAVLAGKAITAQESQFAMQPWTPLASQLLAQFTALLRHAEVPHAPSNFGKSPPDERASGWLLVSHTALPVRGPSLAA